MKGNSCWNGKADLVEVTGRLMHTAGSYMVVAGSWFLLPTHIANNLMINLGGKSVEYNLSTGFENGKVSVTNKEDGELLFEKQGGYSKNFQGGQVLFERNDLIELGCSVASPILFFIGVPLMLGGKAVADKGLNMRSVSQITAKEQFINASSLFFAKVGSGLLTIAASGYSINSLTKFIPNTYQYSKALNDSFSYDLKNLNTAVNHCLTVDVPTCNISAPIKQVDICRNINVTANAKASADLYASINLNGSSFSGVAELFKTPEIPLHTISAVGIASLSASLKLKQYSNRLAEDRLIKHVRQSTANELELPELADDSTTKTNSTNTPSSSDLESNRSHSEKVSAKRSKRCGDSCTII